VLRDLISSLTGNQSWAAFLWEILLVHCCMNKVPLQVTDGLLVHYADDTTSIYCGPTPAAAAALMNSQLQLVKYDWGIWWKAEPVYQ